MKKFLAAVLLAVASTVASATDFGLVWNRDFSGTDRNAVGATIGQKFGSWGVQAGFERFQKFNNQDRWSLVGSYDVVKFSDVATLSVKGGGAYLANQNQADGFAWIAGAGLDIPLTKTIAWTIDYKYQWGQDRVKMFNGNTLGTGVKFSF
jgi:opacity protein-like surface antigen